MEKKYKNTFSILIWTAYIIILFPFSVQAVDVTIGTGGIQGIYYPTGGNICSMVNSKPEYGINCSVMPTGGSIYNINSVLSGTLEFGIAQSDRQYEALNGLGFWQGAGRQEKLRSIFSIHYEAVTILSASDARINSVEDLIGKVVNLGPPGSGGYQSALDVLTNAGIDYLTNLTTTEYNNIEANDIVYAFTKEIFDNHSSFIQLHPVYEFLTKNDMLKGLTAPIHPGAEKYYDEVYVYTSPATNLLLLEK